MTQSPERAVRFIITVAAQGEFSEEDLRLFRDIRSMASEIIICALKDHYKELCYEVADGDPLAGSSSLAH